MFKVQAQLSGQFHWKFFQQLTSSEKLCFLNGLHRLQCLYSHILISTNELMRKLELSTNYMSYMLTLEKSITLKGYNSRPACL